MLFENENFIDNKFTIDELLQKSWRFRNSDEFKKFFDFINRFHHYSRYNTMLVYIQSNAVTFFGGVSFWKKKFNRTIKEDARPFIILAPKGPVMLVYDIFETEGKESPEKFLEKGLGRKPNEVVVCIDEKIFLNAIRKLKNGELKYPINRFPISMPDT